MQEEIKTEDVKEVIIGEFKTKRKLLNFVSAVNGSRIRFIRDIAFLKGEKLSGILEGAIFKITICDEGTINFEEQEGTNLSDKSMIQRLINEIDEMDVTGYAQKFVLNGLEFSDIDGKLCYLEVEHQKPIDKLKSLFDEPKTELSDRGFSILDSLFSSESDEELDREFEGESDEEILSEKDAEIFVEAIENPVEPSETLKKASESYLEAQFRKMNEEKIIELETRIEDTQKEIVRCKMDIKQSENKLNEKSESLGVLETRLLSMKPGDEPNGYVFFVSEELKNMEGLDETETNIANKIADIMKLKKDVLMGMLTEGYYKIKIAKKEDITNQDFALDKEIYNKVVSIDILGKFSVTDEGFEYRGGLNWHQLVGKMIRNGFEQEPEFDKLCNSNSYDSKEEEKSTEMDLGSGVVVKSDEGFVSMGNGVFGIPPSNSTPSNSTPTKISDSEVKTNILMSYSEPTDFVILGCDYDGRDIEITDDYTGLDIYEGGKPKFSIETEGHVSIMSINRYKQWIKECGDECGEGCDAVLVSGYTGDIRVGAKLEDGTFSTDFNFNDYIQHQIWNKNRKNECESVFIDFPVGTQVNEIKDHDLNSVISYLRDSKINKIIK
jgi:hypothetical protein